MFSAVGTVSQHLPANPTLSQSFGNGNAASSY